MIRKSVISALVCGASVVGVSAGSVLAGEVTGSGQGGPNDDGVTGMVGKASSVCAFSGLEDNPANEAEDDNPKPGRLTQTPHYFYQDGEGPVFPPPGTPGTACRGND